MEIITSVVSIACEVARLLYAGPSLNCLPLLDAQELRSGGPDFECKTDCRSNHAKKLRIRGFQQADEITICEARTP